MRGIREATGPDFPIFIKMNVTDGDTRWFGRGMTADDVATAARCFEDAGTNCLVLSGGFILANGISMLRGSAPLRAMVMHTPSIPRRILIFIFGKWIVPEYSFDEAFFLEQALVVRRATSLPLMLCGGLHSAESIATALNNGFELVGLGRCLALPMFFVLNLMI